MIARLLNSPNDVGGLVVSHPDSDEQREPRKCAGMSDHPQGLKSGFRLRDYEIGRVLGSSEIGFKYLGFDHNLKEQVAITEYLPTSLAIRDGPRAVMPRSSSVESPFQELLGQFLAEARALAQIQHPDIIRVRRILEANGTGYVVMDYAEGRTLSAILRGPEVLETGDVNAILHSVLEAVEELHDSRLLHQDIRPGNIVLRDDCSTLLLAVGAVQQGQGAARQAFGETWKNRHAALPPSVYAPIELYSDNGTPGPWTDIYSLGATLYHCVTGSIPHAAPERILRETMTSLSESPDTAYQAGTLAGIDAALAIRPEDRPKSISEWRDVLSGASWQSQGHAVGRAMSRTAVRGALIPADTDAGSAEGQGRKPRWVAPSLALTAATALIVYLDAGILRASDDNLAAGATGALAADDSSPVQLDVAEPHWPSSADGGAILVVETDPPTAEVLVAGRRVGETPLRLAGLPTGAFDITLRHPYYEAVELANQAFESRRELHIKRSLTRATGGLIVTTEPPGAWVELNGRRVVQRTPGTLRNVSAGPARLTVGAVGHRPTNVLVEVPNGGMGYLTYALRPNH